MQPVRKTEVSSIAKKPDEDPFDARSIIGSLENLMNRVTEKECTATTVAAACQCAGRITDLLRVHLEAKRMANNKKL